MRKLPEGMVEFWDEGEHKRDHEAFKRWQHKNRRGWVLNVLPDEPENVFHKSGCPHIIVDFTKSDVSFTKHRKVCSPTDAGALTKYGSNQPQGWRRCDTCSGKSHERLWQ